MQSVATQFERRVPLRVVANEESSLRVVALDPSVNPADHVLRWARILELSLVFASLHDAILQLNLATVADVQHAFARVDALVVTLSRLDPSRVVAENAELLRPFAQLRPKPEDPATIDTETLVRNTRSLLLHFPVAEIQRASRQPEAVEAAHRCWLALDGLKAFIARHESPDQHAVAVAGQVYADGRATIEEVAAMLGRDVPDVLVLLEERGYRRSVDGLRLTDAQRTEKLRRIREERIARGGTPAATDSDIARDVIASQRIEGVDARPWLRS